jgi:hypothetical protein
MKKTKDKRLQDNKNYKQIAKTYDCCETDSTDTHIYIYLKKAKIMIIIEFY